MGHRASTDGENREPAGHAGRHRIRTELHPELRALLVGNYVVFYRIMQDTVAVVRVLHGARNITAELFAE
jgi:toxin ParE1/3/4